MPDPKSAERAKRFRRERRARGDREMNIWVPTAVIAGLEEALAQGRFKTRQDAIQAALVAAFVREEVSATS